MNASGPVTVREVVNLLRRWQARLLAGESGLEHSVSWASTMRARLPAFEGFQGGELALLSMATLRALQAQVVELSLPAVVEQLAEIGVSVIAVAGLGDVQTLSPEDVHALDEARARANQLSIPLVGLPQSTPLAEVEREVIAHVVARRERHPLSVESSEVYAVHLRASLRSEALDALLTGTYAGESAMRARAAQLGYDLTQPHVVLWIDLAPRERMAGLPVHPADSTGSTAPDPVAARLAEEMGTALGAWARARDTQVAALLSLTRTERGTLDVAERTGILLARALGEHEWAAGLGEPATTPSHVHRSASEARDAARLGWAILGPRRIARPADLGLYRLLLALRDSGDLAPFVERTLAPLLADARTGDALVETLDAFFACNGNLSEAARRLHLHRNSLLYRLNRARDLLGQDLDDPDFRLSLQLAIKGLRVLKL